MRLLSGLLEKFVKKGTLRLYDASGRLHVFGGKLPGPVVTARINRRGLETTLFLNPELRAGEAYMDGALTFEEGSTIQDLLMLFSLNRSTLYSQFSRLAETAAELVATPSAMASGQSGRQGRAECPASLRHLD